MEDPRCKMKNAARGCPRNLIWRPMCQNRIFQIWLNFAPMGPGPWLGWQWRPRILGMGLMGANAPKSGPYIHQLVGSRLQTDSLSATRCRHANPQGLLPASVPRSLVAPEGAGGHHSVAFMLHCSTHAQVQPQLCFTCSSILPP